MWPVYLLGGYVLVKLFGAPKASPRAPLPAGKGVLRWQPLIAQEAAKHSWPAGFRPVPFALATLHHESGGAGKPNLISRPNKNGSRDYGLFQANDRYFKERGLTATTALDPGISTWAAMNLLNKLAWEYHGDPRAIAGAYNAGHYPAGNVAYQNLTLQLYEKYKRLAA